MVIWGRPSTTGRSDEPVTPKTIPRQLVSPSIDAAQSGVSEVIDEQVTNSVREVHTIQIVVDRPGLIPRGVILGALAQARALTEAAGTGRLVTNIFRQGIPEGLDGVAAFGNAMSEIKHTHNLRRDPRLTLPRVRIWTTVDVRVGLTGYSRTRGRARPSVPTRTVRDIGDQHRRHMRQRVVCLS